MKRHLSILPIFIAILSLALASCSVQKPSNQPVVGHSKKEQPVIAKNLDHKRRALLEEAVTWLGTPYKYAGQEKGVCTDCSGFVMQVYLQALQVKIPRNSGMQAEFCRELRQKDVKEGDLVFFATGSDPQKVTHVGLMIDDIQFIHASSSKGVVISSMNNNWYASRLLKYGRVPCLD